MRKRVGRNSICKKSELWRLENKVCVQYHQMAIFLSSVIKYRNQTFLGCLFHSRNKPLFALVYPDLEIFHPNIIFSIVIIST